MIIRRMEERDIPEVVIIENDTFSSPWSAESFLNETKSENNLYLVVLDNDEVVGYCGVWGIAGEGQITNVAVRFPSFLRKKGKLMLTQLIHLAREKGMESFTLEVRESNKSALHLYESLGFNSVGVRKDFYTKPTENAVIMWLQE